jgi:hypothetical protein
MSHESAVSQAQKVTDDILGTVGQSSVSTHRRSFRFPPKQAERIERFMNESPMANSCVKYIHGWVMRGFEGIEHRWHDFSAQFVQQAVMYGLVVIDPRPSPPTVIALPNVSLMAQEENGKITYQASLGGSRPTKESPLKVVVCRSPDIYRTRLTSPVYPIIDMHVTLRVMRLSRMHVAVRNATRPVYQVRPDQESGLLKSKIEGGDLMMQMMYGPEATTDVEMGAINNYYRSVEELRHVQEARLKQRQEPHEAAIREEFDLLQCTSMEGDVPHIGQLNVLKPLDNGSVVVSAPETRYSTGDDVMMQYYERQVCECFGVTYEEVLGHRTERLSVKNQGMVESLRRLLTVTCGKAAFRPQNDSAATHVSITNAAQLHSMAQSGLIHWPVARRMLGLKEDDGMPTPRDKPAFSHIKSPGEDEGGEGDLRGGGEPSAKKNKLEARKLGGE